LGFVNAVAFFHSALNDVTNNVSGSVVFSHNSPTDTARELIEPSKDTESRLVSIYTNLAL